MRYTVKRTESFKQILKLNPIKISNYLHRYAHLLPIFMRVLMISKRNKLHD